MSLLGLGSIYTFFKMLTELSSLAVVIPYVVLIYAYLVFRKNNKNLSFKFFKSDVLAYTLAYIGLILSCAGFLGAGLDYVIDSSGIEDVILVLKTYGGPIILTLVGLIIKRASQNLTIIN